MVLFLLPLFQLSGRDVPKFDAAFPGGAADPVEVAPIFFGFDDDDHGRVGTGDSGIMDRLAERFHGLGGEFYFHGIVFREAVYPAAVVEGDFGAAFGTPGVTVFGLFVEVTGVGGGGEE